jgi:hypothetical protein
MTTQVVDDQPLTPLDLARIQAEIHDEVRRRRAAGDFPAGLERELDAMFARYAPATTGGDFKEVLERAERTSYVHADVPTASNHPVLGIVKRLLRTVMAFYVRFLAQEVTAFAGAITRAVQLLGQRVEHIEQATVVAAEQALVEVQRRADGDVTTMDLEPWVSWVVDQLRAAGASGGRVLHVESGNGVLVRGLTAAGFDAYGVEPDEGLAMACATLGLDVRADDPLAHLRSIPDGALSGLVLTGLVDRVPIGTVLEITNAATTKLGPGGVLVIVSVGPATWQRALDPVVADLAPGRPLYPETWRHLLQARRLDHVVIEQRSDEGSARLALVPPRAGDDEAASAVLNANLELLNQLLFSPGPYGVAATRAADS